MAEVVIIMVGTILVPTIKVPTSMLPNILLYKILSERMKPILTKGSVKV